MPKRWTAESFEVRPSTIPSAGLGLFAREPIGIDDTIGYYTGEIVSDAELKTGKFAGSNYILWVTRSHIVVGEGPNANYTRYINHSDTPNAYLVVSTRWKTARFEAVRPIQAGDEIFFNYGDDYWP